MANIYKSLATENQAIGKKEFNSHKVIVIAQSVLDELYKLGLPGVDAITLYNFYYYTANWQKTRQTKATGGYCRKALHWGKERLINAKKILAEKKLIIEVQKSQKGMFSEVYIKLPYKATEKTTADLVEGHRTADLADRPAVGKDTNTTSVSNINALSVNKLEEEEDRREILDTEGRGGESREDTTLISPIPTTVPVTKGKSGPPVSTVPLPDIDVKVKEITSYTAGIFEDKITPLTKMKVKALVEEGYTLDHFKSAVTHAQKYAKQHNIKMNTALLVGSKKIFDNYVRWVELSRKRIFIQGKD